MSDIKSDTKEINVTITVTKYKWRSTHDLRFEFYDAESGDQYRIDGQITDDDMIQRLGSELYSWAECMLDELEE